jgi:predicted deacylase
MKSVERIELGAPSLGSTRHLTVHRYGKPGARPKAYLQASLHADEIPPMLVQHHLIRLLDEADKAGAIRGEIVVVPVANPIGSGQVLNSTLSGRHDAAGGGNFNRRWPDFSLGLADRLQGKLGRDETKNVATVRQAIGEALAEMTASSHLSRKRLALARLAYDSDFVFDLHCDSEALLHLYLNTAHWPSAADLSAEIGSHGTMICDDSGAGSFDETFITPWTRLAAELAGKYPIPVPCLGATIEYRGEADVSDALAEPDARALFRFFQRRGLIAGDPGPLPRALCEATRLEATDIVRVESPGVLAYRVELGARVKKGDVIADLVDPMADDPLTARTAITSKADGLMLTRLHQKLVKPGDAIAKIVGREPLAHHKGTLLDD